MPKIAKLAIQSNLPQLDRLFDYLVPDSLAQQSEIGSRVRVMFGRSKKPLDAFIVEFPKNQSFQAGSVRFLMLLVLRKHSQEAFSNCASSWQNGRRLLLVMF
jgi:primosomal protein N'